MGLLLWPFRFAVYVVLRLIYLAYQCLVFLSKPGAKWLMPIIIIVLAGWQADQLVAFVSIPSVNGFLAQWIPIHPREVQIYAIICVALFIIALLLARPVLRSILGTFPPMRKPMPPTRRLSARLRIATPVRARLVVPRLRHRFRATYQDRLFANLSPAVKSVLNPSGSDQEPLKGVLMPPEITKGQGDAQKPLERAEVSVRARGVISAPPTV